MIKSIDIKNFQSHQHTNIELSAGVNVIVGRSDSGKTAILRDLNWVINNRPSGDSFRSNWGGDTVTTITVSASNPALPDINITRQKSDKENSYYLNGDRFTAVGQSVPDKILKALNINPINIQSQMDAPFLLSTSAGDVAQVLNEIVGLEDIDRAISNINKTLRNTQQDLNRETAALENMKAEVATKYSNLNIIDEEMKALEALNSKVEQIRTSESRLASILWDIKDAQQALPGLERHLKEAPELSELLKMDAIVIKQDEQYRSLITLIRGIKEQRANQARTEKQLKYENEMNILFNLNEDVSTIKSKLNLLLGDVSLLKTAASTLLKIKEKINSKDFEFKKLMPKECPLCGQAVQ